MKAVNQKYLVLNLSIAVAIKNARNVLADSQIVAYKNIYTHADKNSYILNYSKIMPESCANQMDIMCFRFIIISQNIILIIILRNNRICWLNIAHNIKPSKVININFNVITLFNKAFIISIA